MTEGVPGGGAVEPYAEKEMGAVRGWLRYRAATAREASKKLRKDEYWAHMMEAEAERFDRLLATITADHPPASPVVASGALQGGKE